MNLGGKAAAVGAIPGITRYTHIIILYLYFQENSPILGIFIQLTSARFYIEDK